MFLGKFEYSVDAKGRVAIPPKFRDALKSGMVVTKGFDKCLVVYTPAAFTTRAAGYAALATDRAETRKVVRWLYSNSHNIELDGQGRVLIPADLRDWAGISNVAHIVGHGDQIEIWEPERLREVDDEVDKDPAAMAAMVGARP